MDKAKEQIDLFDYAKKAFPNHKFKTVGKSTFVEPCPVCGHHEHFSIYRNENSYSSFADCCKGGSIVDFIMEFEHLSLKDAIRKTLGLAGFGENIERKRAHASKTNCHIDEQASKEAETVEYSLEPEFNDMTSLKADPVEPINSVQLSNSNDFTSLIMKTHSLVSETDYFLNRGLTVKTIEQYKLGYHPEGFNFAIRELEVLEEKENELMGAYKYFLPVWDSDGVCQYFITRLEGESVPSWANNYGKTHNIKGMKVRLFNDRYLTGGEVQGEFIFITEGIFDALSLEEFEYPTIALNSVENAKLLLETLNHALENIKGKTFILIPDCDKAGERLSVRLVDGFKKLGLVLKVINLPAGYKDCNEFLVANRAEIKNFIQKNLNIIQNNDFAIDYLDDFRQKILQASKDKIMKTGFKELDEKLGGGLYPGLYVIGSDTSMGKTTLVLQIADNVAMNGDIALYFSLEMGRNELIARSISRELNAINPRSKYSSKDIRQNKIPLDLYDKGQESYKKIATNIAIIEGNFGLGVKEIRERVDSNIRLTGKKTLVIVDYLQILKPMNPRMNDKQQVIEYNISELKRISRDFDIPVIVISSFNRSNYNTVTGYESFKETGAIEYSADVIIGMQLAGIEDIAKGKTETDKRNLSNKLKSQEPRGIQLAIIKQRDGLAYSTQAFKYFTRVNLFQEMC